LPEGAPPAARARCVRAWSRCREYAPSYADGLLVSTPFLPSLLMDSVRIYAKTSGSCWSTYFHAIQPRLLRWILHVPGPSITAYARHNFGTLGLTNSIRPLVVFQKWRSTEIDVTLALMVIVS